jgi:hypothetical protein
MEVYCYRVVFPFGVSVRFSPDIEAEKTGEILTCGTVIDSTKSLVLDGVNYVKLADDRGWVFSMKNEVPVLDLIEVRRPSPTVLSPHLSPRDQIGYETTNTNNISSCPALLNPMPSASQGRRKSLSDSPHSNHSDDSMVIVSDKHLIDISVHVRSPSPEFAQYVIPTSSPSTPSTTTPRKSIRRGLSNMILTNQNGNTRRRTLNLWKELRFKVRACQQFQDFADLVTQELPMELQPPSIPEPGPARSAWMSSCDGEETDHFIRVKISILAAVTRSCIEWFSDVSGLEAHLWVITHLGAADVSHILRLYDQAAQERFERITSLEFRLALLAKLNEVGVQCKVHTVELGAKVDMLADDIRHFLQRWVIIKVREQEMSPPGSSKQRTVAAGTSSSSTSSSSLQHPKSKPGSPSFFTNANKNSDHSRVTASPTQVPERQLLMTSHEMWQQWGTRGKKLWTELVVSCTGDLFVNGEQAGLSEEEEDEAIRDFEKRAKSSKSHENSTGGAPIPPTSRTMQVLKNWWTETKEYTTAVVMDPDYHVPVGL